jgi:hypothetical protein
MQRLSSTPVLLSARSAIKTRLDDSQLPTRCPLVALTRQQLCAAIIPTDEEISLTTTAAHPELSISN